MKKLLTMLLVGIVALFSVLPVYAARGAVTYDGDARRFIFAPGGDHSLTDLFPNFKGVMPGDALTQRITVKNDASRDVKVRIYIRSLGAHEGSAEFLSQLGLTVAKSDDNEMAYMFDAAADETAGLTDWVYLGTLYSGGEVNLDVTLTVPTELDDAFESRVGYLDWEFKVEELPAEQGDPQAPQTSDRFRVEVWSAAMLGSLVLMLVLLLRRRAGKEREEDTVKR